MAETTGSKEIIGRFPNLGVDDVSAPIEVVSFSQGSLQATWSGVDVFDGVLNIQISIDKIGWNDSRGGALVERIVNIAAGTQIWEIKRFTGKYVRLNWINNSNTAGSLSWMFLGSDR